MHDYRLYFLNDRGHFTDAIEFECEDDAQAISVAEGRVERVAKELWQRARLVKRFPGKSALD